MCGESVGAQPRDWLDGWPKFVPYFETEPKKTGLIIIDLQYCDAHRDYGAGKVLRSHNPQMWEYYFSRVEKVVIPNTLRLLQFFRDHGLRVIFIALGSELPDYADLSPWRRKKESSLESTGGARSSFYKKEFEYSFLPGLEPQEGELVVHKTTSSVFNSAMLYQKLHNMGIDGLVVAGVITNGCVWASSQGAADLGFKTIIVEDACATLDEGSHNATLKNFARLYGHVKTSEEVIAEFAQQMARI